LSFLRKQESIPLYNEKNHLAKSNAELPAHPVISESVFFPIPTTVDKSVRKASSTFRLTFFTTFQQKTILICILSFLTCFFALSAV